MRQSLDDIVLVEGNNELNVGMVPVAPVSVEITSITVSPTSLTDRQHEYNTHLGLGYWGDPFTISITFSNPFPYDVFVHPDYAFGKLTGEPLKYVGETLQGFEAAELLYFRLLLDTEYMQGDYSYTVDWQQLYHPQNHGSNMPQFVKDPDGIAVMAAGGDCWLKVPAKSEATTVKQAHLGTGISGLLPDTFDLCVVANKAFYLYWEPHYRTVGGVQYLVNWKSATLDPCVAAVPDALYIERTIFPPPPPTCPECGSTNLSSSTIPYTPTLIYYTCKDCGHTWAEYKYAT